MPTVKSQPVLSLEERSEKRKLLLKDAGALLVLLLITLVLVTATVFLFRSFSSLRGRLSQRWLARGENALHDNRPSDAVEDLRSALAYAPGQRNIEVELAEALAAAGRTQEATSYFNTLWEAEPGSGIINLQLARLAVRQGNQTEALDHYRASIYGNWEGDGSVRRREVRLELIRYLIGVKRFDQARSELLIAAGNAPEDPAIQLSFAPLMEQAGDFASASGIYKEILQHQSRNLIALEGAGRAAFALGNFVQARDYIERALAVPAEAAESAQARQNLHDILDQAVDTLLLYPSPQLSSLAQAQRVLHDRSLVFERLRACDVPVPLTSPSKSKPNQLIGPPQVVPPNFTELMAKWQALGDPSKLTVAHLQNDEQLRRAVIGLVYASEQAADKYCGLATGENALLAKIAANPGAVEAE
jgi:tetratricopeptide (TPR) repeat protein